MTADLKDKSVVVVGYRSVAKSCEPSCKLFVNSIVTAQSTALTPITQTPGFGSADVVTRYDAAGPR